MSLLLALLVIGCAAGQRTPSMTTRRPGSTASTPSMDERVRIFFSTISGGQKAIDQGTFLSYYRRQVVELSRSSTIKKMGKDETARHGTQLFRKLDRNHDAKITEEELKFALTMRARERQKPKRINPREWNLLDDAWGGSQLR